MHIEIQVSQFNELTKRLDLEVHDALHVRLEPHYEITVERRKLNAGVIFAAYTDRLRIEILSAFIPVAWKNKDKCVISSSRVKFLLNRYWLRQDQGPWWRNDATYGERGTVTYCVDPMDVDGIAPFVELLADHILHHLSPAFA